MTTAGDWSKQYLKKNVITSFKVFKEEDKKENTRKEKSMSKITTSTYLCT
jgi:hypothetical protein